MAGEWDKSFPELRLFIFLQRLTNFLVCCSSIQNLDTFGIVDDFRLLRGADVWGIVVGGMRLLINYIN